MLKENFIIYIKSFVPPPLLHLLRFQATSTRDG